MGVFATRSPHRPNPIGMSVARIVRVEGLIVHVRDLDVLDGTPVLDLKPYVAYADAHPDAKAGWLEVNDPRDAWEVTFSPEAIEQLAWLRERGVDLRAPIASALALGPQPHAYRRIRKPRTPCASPSRNGASTSPSRSGACRSRPAQRLPRERRTRDRPGRGAAPRVRGEVRPGGVTVVVLVVVVVVGMGSFGWLVRRAGSSWHPISEAWSPGARLREHGCITVLRACSRRCIV